MTEHKIQIKLKPVNWFFRLDWTKEPHAYWSTLPPSTPTPSTWTAHVNWRDSGFGSITLCSIECITSMPTETPTPIVSTKIHDFSLEITLTKAVRRQQTDLACAPPKDYSNVMSMPF